MGRSKIVPIVVRLVCRKHIITPMPWPKELGRPTDQSVSRYVVDLERSGRYGGVNYDARDPVPMIVETATVVSQLTGETLVTWTRKQTPSLDPRVIAVRRDPVVGRGSCSMIDECHEDIELIDKFEDTSHGAKRVTSPAAAVRACRQAHRLYAEREADVRNA